MNGADESLDRRERIERVLDLCQRFLRNWEYYRTGWAEPCIDFLEFRPGEVILKVLRESRAAFSELTKASKSASSWPLLCS